ncbi:hypothetical protein GN956_G25626 [Arapaima gigas]
MRMCTSTSNENAHEQRERARAEQEESRIWRSSSASWRRGHHGDSTPRTVVSQRNTDIPYSGDQNGTDSYTELLRGTEAGSLRTDFAMSPMQILTAAVVLFAVACPSMSTVFKRVTADVKGSALLPCTGPAPKGPINVNWKVNGKKVAQLHQGEFTAGPAFESRVHLSEKGIEGGNFSLIIRPVVYSDKGFYSCFSGTERLDDVQLDVVVPTEVSVPVGGAATLPCFASVDRQADDAQLNVRWEKEGKLVLLLRSGLLDEGSGFENRVSMSKDDIRKGDLSLTLNTTRLSDQGGYQCFYEDKTGCLGRVNLTISAHEDTLSVPEGQSILLLLCTTEPVRVEFYGSADQSTAEPVCEVEGGLARCETQYRHRVSVQNGKLELRDASSSDTGVFRVTEHRSNIVVGVVSVSVSSSPHSGQGHWIWGVTLGLIVIVFVGLSIYCVKRRKPKMGTSQQETIALNEQSQPSQQSSDDTGYVDRCLGHMQGNDEDIKTSVPESHHENKDCSTRAFID